MFRSAASFLDQFVDLSDGIKVRSDRGQARAMFVGAASGYELADGLRGHHAAWQVAASQVPR
jgi:hypothetical protein